MCHNSNVIHFLIRQQRRQTNFPSNVKRLGVVGVSVAVIVIGVVPFSHELFVSNGCCVVCRRPPLDVGMLCGCECDVTNFPPYVCLFYSMRNVHIASYGVCCTYVRVYTPRRCCWYCVYVWMSICLCVWVLLLFIVYRVCYIFSMPPWRALQNNVVVFVAAAGGGVWSVAASVWLGEWVTEWMSVCALYVWHTFTYIFLVKSLELVVSKQLNGVNIRAIYDDNEYT